MEKYYHYLTLLLSTVVIIAISIKRRPSFDGLLFCFYQHCYSVQYNSQHQREGKYQCGSYPAVQMAELLLYHRSYKALGQIYGQGDTPEEIYQTVVIDTCIVTYGKAYGYCRRHKIGYMSLVFFAVDRYQVVQGYKPAYIFGEEQHHTARFRQGKL